MPLRSRRGDIAHVPSAHEHIFLIIPSLEGKMRRARHRGVVIADARGDAEAAELLVDPNMAMAAG